MQLILASSSPARLTTLRAAGLDPTVHVSGVDEDEVTADSVAALVLALAEAKAQTVAAATAGDRLVIGCDSLLDLAGEPLGKPGNADTARARWRRMRGRAGVLRTGHHVIRVVGDRTEQRSAAAATTVHFAELSDAEVDAYVATGEPLQVAGAFTVDGLGGPFVTRIEGDHHNVVGISLPLLRTMIIDLGLTWPDLWAPTSVSSSSREK